MLLQGLGLYLVAFFDLTSCRTPGFGMESRIPWTAIQRWCDEYELEGDDRDDVFYHITQLDLSYLIHQRKEAGSKDKR